MLGVLLKWIRLSESIVATTAYAVVALLLMVDVIGRELFETTFIGTQQLAIYGAIVAGFLGLTLATSDNAHLRPEFMDFVGRRHEQAIIRIGDLVSGGFFIAGAYVATTFVLVSAEMGDRAPVLYFTLWPLQLVLPYAFASAGLKHLIFAIQPGLKPASSGMEG